MNVRRSPALSHASVLIVDDEADNRELLRIILNWAGFATKTATGGEEALLSVAADPPDLILIDLMMPGLDGYQLTARLKQNPETRAIPLIMLSAMNDSATRARALSTGADAYISKPFDRSELCEQVCGVLGVSPSPPESGRARR